MLWSEPGPFWRTRRPGRLAWRSLRRPEAGQSKCFCLTLNTGMAYTGIDTRKLLANLKNFRWEGVIAEGEEFTQVYWALWPWKGGKLFFVGIGWWCWMQNSRNLAPSHRKASPLHQAFRFPVLVYLGVLVARKRQHFRFPLEYIWHYAALRIKYIIKQGSRRGVTGISCKLNNSYRYPSSSPTIIEQNKLLFINLKKSQVQTWQRSSPIISFYFDIQMLKNRPLSGQPHLLSAVEVIFAVSLQPT